MYSFIIIRCDHVFSPFKIRTRDICQRVNRKMVISTPELHPVPVKAHIGIDFVGPLPTTLKGNRYILTISNYFSKFAEAVLLSSKKADGVSAALFKVMPD